MKVAQGWKTPRHVSPPLVAVLDKLGTIIATNEVWHPFAETSLVRPPYQGIGCNYLAIWESLTGEHADWGQTISRGIREVLTKQKDYFYMEYPFPSGREDQGFALRVTRIENQGTVRLLIMHDPLTRCAGPTETFAQSSLHPLFENVPDMIFIKDAQELRFLQINQAGEQLLGYPRQELIGKTVYDIFPKDQADALTLIDREVLATGCPLDISEISIETKSRGVRDFHTKEIPLLDEQGYLTSLLNISVDMTERKSLHTQLEQAQKYEIVGRLAGGVAHDLNNLLTPILGHADLLLESHTMNVSQKREVRKILGAASRGAALLQHFLAFSRQQPGSPQVLDVYQHVKEFEDFLGQSLGKDIEMSVTRNGEQGFVTMDSTQLDQIVLNLAINARDAMPHGGKLTVTIKNARIEKKEIPADSKALPGSFLCLSMADTGEGMDEQVRSKIFEPFFTTKEKGKGTGLGLSIVERIVKNAGGFFTVTSQVGQGTTFFLYFPQIGQQSLDAHEQPAT